MKTKDRYMTIESFDNPKLKELRKLHSKKWRQRTGMFVAEGRDLLAAALAQGVQPQALFVDALRLDELAESLRPLDARCEIFAVQPRVLARSSTLGSGSEVVGIWHQRWNDVVPPQTEVVVYLHELGDPANVGAVVRSTRALVGDGVVVVSEKSADPFAPKAVRASMGALFSQTLVRSNFDQLRSALGGFEFVALAACGGGALAEAKFARRVVICVGAEREGLPEPIVASCGRVVSIEIDRDAVESLNAAVACGIALHAVSDRRIRAS